jgi:putative tryptophan/tyrosine transport system substrate-binding protein
LKEIAPRTVRVSVLFNPATSPFGRSYLSSIETAASLVAVEVSAAPVDAKDKIEGVISKQARSPGGSLIMLPDPFNTINRDLIVALAAQYPVPAIFTIAFLRNQAVLSPMALISRNRTASRQGISTVS